MLAVLLSAAVGAVFGPAVVWLVRERLHMGCGTYPPGTEGAGTRTCADGIAYLPIAAELGAMWLLTTMLGSMVAGAVRDRQRARVGLVLLASAATGGVLGSFWVRTLQLVRDENSPITAEELWTAAIGPAAAVSIGAVILAVVAVCLRGRAAVVLTIGATMLMLVAVVLQPGLGFNLIPTAGLLAAAVARSPTAAR